MSILIDLEGTLLSVEESELLKHPVCSGVVLFSRNYHDRSQLCHLTDSIRRVNPMALVAVDQEGGRVQRFLDGFTVLPPMSHWGQSYQRDPQACIHQLSLSLHTMATELQQVGVNLNLIPVLDINHGKSEIIGERSLHHDPKIVAELGHLIINELHRYHFPAVGKHFPGHGAVVADSHQTLPVDHRDWTTIWNKDLMPFVALTSQLDAVMPAHIIFSAMDNRPASFSPFWLQEVLRGKLGFQGLVMSDDLTMNAAASRGDYRERAVEAFLAGCDLLLICNNRSGAIDALNTLLNYDRQQSMRRIANFSAFRHPAT